MRTLITVGTFVLVSAATQTSASALGGGRGSGSMLGHCKAQCNIINTGAFQPLKPNEQVCVRKCMAEKKAAQH